MYSIVCMAQQKPGILGILQQALELLKQGPYTATLMTIATNFICPANHNHSVETSQLVVEPLSGKPMT